MNNLTLFTGAIVCAAIITNNMSNINNHPLSFCESNQVIGNYINYSPEIAKNLKLLESFANLEKGWNGYDAEPISRDLVSKVQSIVCQLQTQPEIFPTGRKSIQLEYENEEGYLEFEIFDNFDVLAYVEQGNIKKEEKIDLRDISNWVKEFYG